MTTKKTKKTETLAEIAQRYGVDPYKLRPAIRVFIGHRTNEANSHRIGGRVHRMIETIAASHKKD